MATDKNKRTLEKERRQRARQNLRCRDNWKVNRFPQIGNRGKTADASRVGQNATSPISKVDSGVCICDAVLPFHSKRERLE